MRTPVSKEMLGKYYERCKIVPHLTLKDRRYVVLTNGTVQLEFQDQNAAGWFPGPVVTCFWCSVEELIEQQKQMEKECPNVIESAVKLQRLFNGG